MTEFISALGLSQSARGRDLPPWIARYYTGYLTRNAELLAEVLDDDVDWLLAGPAEQFDFFGHRRGKDSVIELVTRILPCFYHVTDFEIGHLLFQNERLALYGRVRARQRDTGRSICFRAAQFLRFRDGKLVWYRGIGDTFDAAEQLVGHAIDVTREMESAPLVPDEEELAILSR